MIKICFVCAGNTCRSIMAERLMKRNLKKLKVKDISVTSKGLNAKGDNIAENAKQALKIKGALASNRKSVKLGKIDVKTIYVVMTEQQKALIKSTQVLSFKDLIGQEIVDPYGQDLQTYLTTCEQLEKGVEILIEKIIKWRG